jgi:hypothetical protein
MASPFRYFRKHTKAFYAVASVIAIALFVFGRGTGSGGGSSNPNQRHANATVASWNGGSINEGQLSAYVQHRLITNDFLRMLFLQGGGQSGYDLPGSVPNFVISPNPMEAVELEVINTEVFSSLATQSGMTVSDNMINHYLEEFGLRRVDSEGIRGILSHMGQKDARSNEAVIFSTLHKLLLAYFYRRAYEDAGAVVLPEQRWEDWRRVNERISLEAAKLPVEEFLDKVAEPTEAQLKALYEEFKEADPDMMVSVGGREMPSPNPAFAVPRRVKLQYLLGSVAERTKKQLDSVTEADIADYYERNKRKEFTKSDMDDSGFDLEAPPTDGPAAGAGTTPADGAGGAASPAGGSSAPPATGEAAPPATNSTPAAGGTAEPATPTTDGATPAAPSGATPASPAAATGDQSQSAPRRSPFRMTALQAAADAPASPPATDATTAPAATGAPASAAADATPAAPATTGGETPAVPPADEAKSGEEPKDATAAAAAAEAKVEYVPLEKVRDEIRETLAREKAVAQLQKEADEAFTKVLLEYNQYGRQVAMAHEQEKEAPAPQEKLKDLKWLADAYGMSLVTTDPLTMRELYDLPVGKATDDQAGRMLVTQAVFSSLEPFEPFLAKELEGNWYVVTKIEDSPRRVPPFEEVRDKVAAAWKRIEAGKLALKTGKDLAAASEKDAESFEAFFKDKGYEVVPQTALFSWRRFPVDPAMGSPPELSGVPELKNVGPDFMQAAFALADAKTVALLNFDHSSAYVIRLHSRQYTPEELKKLFLAEENTWMGRFIMRREHQQDFSQTVNRRIWEDLANFKFDPEWEKRRSERLAAKN